MKSTRSITAALQAPRKPVLTIDLDRIAKNIKAIKERIGEKCELMAVIKDNFYGLGDDGSASLKLIATMLKCGISIFCVARFDEAISLRSLGVQCPILVLEEMDPGEAGFVNNYNIIPTVTTVEAADALQTISGGSKFKIHVKVNTGPDLNGVEQEELIDLLDYIKKRCLNLNVEGLYTHFLDASDDQLYSEQLTVFNNLITQLEEQTLLPPIIHAANSETTLHRETAFFSRVRCGAALYGIIPDPEFSSVCSLTTTITRIRHLKKGQKVGYNFRHNNVHILSGNSGYDGFYNVADRDSTLATLFFGFGDGGIVREYIGKEQPFAAKDKRPCVLVRGARAPLVGEPNMDKMLIDITDISSAVEVGDEVTVFGEDENTLHEIAPWFRKKPAEFSSQLRTARIERRCISKEEPAIPLQALSLNPGGSP